MNTMNTLKTTAAAIALAFGVTSFAAISADDTSMIDNQQPLEAEFVKLDTKADGSLTLDEASKDKLFTKQHFSNADVDKNGTLSQDEHANYKSADQQKKMGVLVDDSVITTKAKAELLATKDLRSLQVSVETRKGQVILSGFVDNAAMKAKAEEVVAKIDGVKSVKNSLVVKK